MAGNSSQARGRSVTSKVLALLDAFTPADPELSLNELSRRTGLPMSTTLGSTSVAAPVFDAQGRVTAALAVVLRSSRPNLQRLAPAVRTAAISISPGAAGTRGPGRAGVLRTARRPRTMTGSPGFH